MRYIIHYACLSHIGCIRSNNQDNFICDGQYMDENGRRVEFPLQGIKKTKENAVFGIFDGMGGEECGEVAAYIAAKNAAEINVGEDAAADLSRFCYKANAEICDYAASHEVSAMGTTAAMLAFTDKGIALCNIGDSKILRMCNGDLEQISKDHLSVAAYGVKPPLSQNLGIPPSELIIDPYLARGSYHEGDIYLICSDGLTDMVSTGEIAEALCALPVYEATQSLCDKAIANGGKDNITIILCKVERERKRLFW